MSDSNRNFTVKLPDELLVHAFKEGELDYTDLKCVSRVCKRFNRLVKDKTFDADLFRQAPSGKLSKGSTFLLHPLVNTLDFVMVGQKSATLYSYLTDSEEDYEVYDLHSANEFATSPAVKTIVVKMPVTSTVVKSSSGVTVRQLVKGVGQMWEEKLQKGRQGYEYFGAGSTVRDLLGDHNGWTGWDSQRILNEGVIALTAEHFDS